MLLQGFGNGLAHLGHTGRIEGCVELFTGTWLYVVFYTFCVSYHSLIKIYVTATLRLQVQKYNRFDQKFGW
jgi:hypothetical protein